MVSESGHQADHLPVSVVLNTARETIEKEISTIDVLSRIASQYPYYKYNYAWTREMQGTVRLPLSILSNHQSTTNTSQKVYSILLTGYLGGLPNTTPGQLLTLEEVGALLQIPTNLKDRDAFHLTIEEYLHAMISLLDELTRLARNSVTLGDYQRPQQIAKFIKDVHAGFQILNLKNDSLRKRSDGVKYRVKEIEDVVYDLSLRGLLPKE